MTLNWLLWCKKRKLPIGEIEQLTLEQSEYVEEIEKMLKRNNRLVAKLNHEIAILNELVNKSKKL